MTMFERSKARFSLRLFLASPLVAVGLFGTGAASAQTTPTPTAAQMEVFKNLPPDQQRMILQQMQGGSSKAKTSSKSTEPGAVTTVTPKELSAAEQEKALEALREPRLRAGDTIVIELAIRAPGEDDRAQSIAEEKKKKELEKAQAQAKLAETTK